MPGRNRMLQFMETNPYVHFVIDGS